MESIFTVNALLLFGALMVLAGILSSLVATRFGAPILLVFLLLGMLAGEEGLLRIPFSDYRTTYLVGSLALAVILFDGGLRTKFQRFRGALKPSLLLATLGVLITALLVGAAAHYALGYEALEALLLGSIVASTDAAAVFFLLRAGGLHLKGRVGAVLEIESGTNDPFAVFLTLVLTQLVLASGAHAFSAVMGELLRQGALGTLFGLSGGLSLVWLLNRLQLPGGLHPLLAVAAAIAIYGLTALLGGSGFLAVYLAGLMLGNRPLRAYPSIVSFHDAATWLCQIVMFLLLGLLVTPTKLLPYLWPALGIALFLMVVARPVAVWLCLFPYGFAAKEKAFIAWVGLRGAVSIFLAAIPTLAHVPHADAYFNVAFFVVLISLLVQGWTLNFAARKLGLALRRTLPNVARIEVDIPGQFEHEMVGYPIEAGSFVLERNMLPSWARPVLVVRGGEILGPAEAGELLEDDYAYFLAPADRVHRLDRLFAGPLGRRCAVRPAGVRRVRAQRRCLDRPARGALRARCRARGPGRNRGRAICHALFGAAARGRPAALGLARHAGGARDRGRPGHASGPAARRARGAAQGSRPLARAGIDAGNQTRASRLATLLAAAGGVSVARR